MKQQSLRVTLHSAHIVSGPASSLLCLAEVPPFRAETQSSFTESSSSGEGTSYVSWEEVRLQGSPAGEGSAAASDGGARYHSYPPLAFLPVTDSVLT